MFGEQQAENPKEVSPASGEPGRPGHPNLGCAAPYLYRGPLPPPPPTPCQLILPQRRLGCGGSHIHACTSSLLVSWSPQGIKMLVQDFWFFIIVVPSKEYLPVVPKVSPSESTQNFPLCLWSLPPTLCPATPSLVNHHSGLDPKFLR